MESRSSGSPADTLSVCGNIKLSVDLVNPVRKLHCLYCDRPLSLLQRRNGDTEFCSAEHGRLYYKQEWDRLLKEQPSVLIAEPLPSNPETLKVIVCAHRVLGSSEKAERWMKSYSEPL